MKKRLAIMSVFAAVISAGTVYLFLHIDFIPNASSAERETIDHLLKVLFAIASVFFTVIAVVFIDTLLFFRRRRGDVTDGPSAGATQSDEVILQQLRKY